MLSVLNKKLLTLLVSPSKATTTKLISSNYATRAPDNDQNMVLGNKGSRHHDKLSFNSGFVQIPKNI